MGHEALGFVGFAYGLFVLVLGSISLGIRIGERRGR